MIPTHGEAVKGRPAAVLRNNNNHYYCHYNHNYNYINNNNNHHNHNTNDNNTDNTNDSAACAGAPSAARPTDRGSGVCFYPRMKLFEYQWMSFCISIYCDISPFGQGKINLGRPRNRETAKRCTKPVCM